MNHLTKEELEKLKVGDRIKCEILINVTNPTSNFYYLIIISIKHGRNGIRIRTHLDYSKEIEILPEIDRVFYFFTINGSFSNSGIHNPGKNYLKRKYYKVCQ